VLNSAGPVRLETYAARFEDIRIDSSLDIEGDRSARLTGAFTIDGQDSKFTVNARLEDAQGQVIRAEEVQAQTGLSWDLAAGDVDIWWPFGYGSQPLYTLHLELVAKVRRRFGLSTPPRKGSQAGWFYT
jgi:beta-mannosidase